MKTLSVYHKKHELSSAACEFLAVPYSMTAIITAYTSFACAWTGSPLPHWYAAGAWITAGVPIAALITFAASEAVRIARRAAFAHEIASVRIAEHTAVGCQNEAVSGLIEHIHRRAFRYALHARAF